MELGEEVLEAYELTNQEPPQPWSDAQRDAFHEWISSHSLPEGTSTTFLICAMNSWAPKQDHPYLRMTLFAEDSIRKQHDKSPGLLKDGLLAWALALTAI